MKPPIDRLMVHELAERPPRLAPPVPDIESTAPYWHGPAVLYGDEWRRRAHAAEARIEQLQRALASTWLPHT